MKIKHHIVRKYHDAKQAPLWKWIVVILVVVAMPMFYVYINMAQTQQAIAVDQALTETNS